MKHRTTFKVGWPTNEKLVKKMQIFYVEMLNSRQNLFIRCLTEYQFT